MTSNLFVEVSIQDTDSNTRLTVFKNKNTNCYYALAEKDSFEGGTSLEQMYIEKDGKSLPYCD